MKADPVIKNEVTHVLKKFTESYNNRDLASALSFFAADDDVMLYGTGADEKRIGIAQIKEQMMRDWEQSEWAEIVFEKLEVSSAASVAWAWMDAEYRSKSEGETLILPVRITNVLEKRNGQWLILHCHFSTPSMVQEEGHSF